VASVRDWTFEGTWPYPPHWFDTPEGRLHYVDEGPRDGRPVGRPWSQDWGGPIGIYWATRHPERVDGLFILNTYAHGWKPEALPPGKDKVPLPLPLHLFRTPIVGELLVKGLDAFKRGFLFGQGVVHRERLTPVVKRAYKDVHRGWSERTAS
jgi:pimeloyl-ACP methyl ester carboxylesterase